MNWLKMHRIANNPQKKETAEKILAALDGLSYDTARDVLAYVETVLGAHSVVTRYQEQIGNKSAQTPFCTTKPTVQE